MKLNTRLKPFAEIDTLCRTLNEYCEWTKTVLAGGPLSVLQAQELAMRVQEIRLLLQHLINLPQSKVSGRTQLALLNGLHAQYLELEGMAKEKRNDLDPAERYWGKQ